MLGQARSRVPRIAEAAVERARLTVVPRGSRGGSRAPFVVLVSLLLVCGVAGLLLFNTSMQQASFTASALQERAQHLTAKEQALRMRLEKLRNPQRVAERAKQQGMVPPPAPAFIRLSDGKVLGDPTPAVPGDAMRITPPPTRKPLSLRPSPVVVRAPAHEKKDEAAGKKKDDGHGAAEAPGDRSAGKKKPHGQRESGGGR